MPSSFLPTKMGRYLRILRQIAESRFPPLPCCNKWSRGNGFTGCSIWTLVRSIRYPVYHKNTPPTATARGIFALTREVGEHSTKYNTKTRDAQKKRDASRVFCPKSQPQIVYHKVRSLAICKSVQGCSFMVLPENQGQMKHETVTSIPQKYPQSCEL